MKYSKILAALRREKGYTQSEAAEYISRHADKRYTFKMISHWEKGVSSPPVEQFLLLCELYGVNDIQGVFRDIKTEYRNMTKLNDLGRSRVEEYVSMLQSSALFSEPDNEAADILRRFIRLYDAPVAAGAGSFLESDSYDTLEVDETVPREADFAVRVSGDSMTPRFIDNQIIFIREQQRLDTGEIGIFELNGDSYVKKLGSGELISLNPRYNPIIIREQDSFHIFGKVVG